MLSTMVKPVLRTAPAFKAFRPISSGLRNFRRNAPATASSARMRERFVFGDPSEEPDGRKAAGCPFSPMGILTSFIRTSTGQLRVLFVPLEKFCKKGAESDDTGEYRLLGRKQN